MRLGTRRAACAPASATTLADSAFNPEGRSAEEILDEAERQIFAIAEARPKTGGPVSVNDLLTKAIDRIDTLFNTDNAITGLSTGYTGRYPHHSFASSDGFVRFVEAGFGYGMLPILQCERQIQAGTLVDLTPGDGLDVPLMWHMWDIQTPFTRTLSDNVIATARKWLLQSPVTSAG